MRSFSIRWRIIRIRYPDRKKRRIDFCPARDTTALFSRLGGLPCPRPETATSGYHDGKAPENLAASPFVSEKD